ncbi:Protein of unknown function [Pyronema omphalodes CBS 100304]|uniref:Uncharacterized protein n=1 Tax=Pyronema omphalodes (strain CBS 100304) TaxID=1076935 RepID=U4L4U0_PYROM|nr:Protein of unknown function [Pyronema omphalodes CBS 100304]
MFLCALYLSHYRQQLQESVTCVIPAGCTHTIEHTSDQRCGSAQQQGWRGIWGKNSGDTTRLPTAPRIGRPTCLTAHLLRLSIGTGKEHPSIIRIPNTNERTFPPHSARCGF